MPREKSISDNKSAKRPSRPSKNILDTKRVYPDRNQQELEKFENFNIIAEDLRTVLLILKSPELKVLIGALNHLDNYIDKCFKNVEVTVELGIISIILNEKLYEHDDLDVKRLTVKMLAGMHEIALPQYEYELMIQIYQIVKNYYLFDADPWIVEYSSVVLVNLLNEPRICVLLETDLEFLKGVLTHVQITNDPDILYQSIKILIKLFQSTSIDMCGTELMPVACLLNTCVNQSFPEIEDISLLALLEITQCAHKQEYENIFKKKMFLEKTYDIIETFNSYEKNRIIIKIYKNLMKSYAISLVFTSENYLRKFCFFLKDNLIYLDDGLAVLSEISRYDDFKEILHESGFVDLLLSFIKVAELIKITPDISIGIKRMMKLPESCAKILENNPVPILLNILNSDALDWKYKEAAVDSLYSLAGHSKQMCENIIKGNLNKTILKILQRPFGEVPIDYITKLLNILNTFTKDYELRAAIMDGNLALALITAIENSFRSGVLMTNLIKCSTGYVCENTLQEEFLKSDIAKIILKCLNSPSTALKTSATDFITLSAKYQPFIQEYFQNDVLSSLLRDEKSSMSNCPSWSAAIEAILSKDLSLKFCVRERLDAIDIIGSKDLHVSKKHWKDFKILKSLITEEVSPMFPLILISFNSKRYTEDFVHVQSYESEESERVSAETNFEEKSMSIIEPHTNEWIYCRRPPDEGLPKYLKTVQEILEIKGLMDNQNPFAIDITKLNDRAQVIAEVVATELCGNKKGIQSETCAEHVVLNHLNHLKTQLHCNIIPLGKIRIGGYFERALLFKSLADQIGLPCTLEKTADGRLLYNLIPVSELQSKPNECQIIHANCNLSKFPKRIFTPNHIVDLMDFPGKLYPIQSIEAYRYLKLL